MASSSRQDRKCEYYILKHDNKVLHETYALTTILNTSRPESLRCLKGTLLCLSPSKPANSGGSQKIPVRSLDDENLEFDCPLADISPLQPLEKDLLIAVTSRVERYEWYACHKDVLAFGLICKFNDWVQVKVKIDGNLTEVAGVIRYRGELPSQQGIHFGVELEEYRGAGTTDGTFRNQILFACKQDCGVFVPITRIKKRYQDYNRNKRHYRRTTDVLEVDSALSPSDIFVNQRVRVYTDEGEKEGHVLYCGLPPGAKTEYVGIEYDHPVKPSDRNDGTYEGLKLFHPGDLERTVLCPKASVLPLVSLDQHSIEPMEISVDPFDFHVGSQVSIDTEHDGIKYGHVIWLGKPDLYMEEHVGIELENPCSRFIDRNDGIYKGKRLFLPKQFEKTVLVPAKSVCTYQRSLSSELMASSVDPFDFTVGSQVFIDTEHDGIKYGHVIWLGKPDLYMEEHVGIELEYPCSRLIDRNDGIYRGKRLFLPKQFEKTVLVPAKSVCTYQRSLSSELMASSVDPFDFTVGSQVFIDTEHDGIKYGHVIWLGKPDLYMEEHVGIELEYPCSRLIDRNDGIYRGKRLFLPKQFEKTVLVPAKSVCTYQRSLSSETVRDSFGADDTAFAAPMVDFGKIQDPIPRRRHHSESSTEDVHVAVGFERPLWTDVSDAIMSTSPGKPHSAPVSDKDSVRVKAHVKSSSTGYMPTYAKYGQTSTIGATSRGTSHPKDTTSKTSALATGKRENNSWTTGTKKFPKSHTESRSRKNETEDRPSADIANTDRETSKVKGHRTIEQDHCRVISKYSVYGRAKDPGEERVKARVKSSSTGYMPTSAKYEQTSTIGGTSRGTTRPKDTTSKTSALATGKRENNSWTTGTKKFPKSHTKSRSRKSETEDRPSADIASTDRKTPKVKGHRTIGQDHGRVVSKYFGNQESPIIEGYVRPQRFQQSFVGENKGIQGDQNSCYLDVTLYSMFSFNLTFDPLLIRPKDGNDVEGFQEIQTIVREKIVNPLRQNGFVRADRVRDLRLHLDKLGLLPGITNEEKDPEELLHMLFRDVLKAQPLIKTRHGDKKEIDNQYLHQIFMEKNESLQLPKVEQVLHQSFLDNELKLVEIPECLIVQMPRFGKDYKMYSRILPSLTIDITDLLESYPRQCTICGELAKVECRDCRPDEEISKDFIKSYCQDCCDVTHISLPAHRTKLLFLNPDVQKGFELISRTKKQELPFQRQRMELYAMLCIQTSHYVAFVKTEPMNWVYFDSMAYRDTSTVPGFNIPKVTHLKNLEGSYPLRTNDQPDDKKLPEHFRRLLGDAYICFYRKIGVKQMGENRVAVDHLENGP